VRAGLERRQERELTEMKMNRGLWAALALAPFAWFHEGTAGAAEPHWSAGLTTPSGEPLTWLANCPKELTRLGLKTCFSSRLVPESYAQQRLLAVHQYVESRLPLKTHGGSSCGSQNTTPGAPVTTVPVGLGADGIAAAYNLNTPGLPDGTGKVIGIVDACGNSKIVTDVATYRTQYNLPALPACTGLPKASATPCIAVVSQTGSTTSVPADDDNWAGEIALDVEMVSAACPKCSILLVEANDSDDSDLDTAVAYAAANADAVTNSYGSSESGSDSDTPYQQSVLIAAASGDNDWYNQITVDTSEADAAAWSASYNPVAPNTPASMPNVLAVGGSMVKNDTSSPTGYSDNVWSFEVTNPALTNLYDKFVYGGGSGCSQEFAKPSFQTQSTGTCTMRDSVDVSGPSDFTPVPAVAGGGGILAIAEGSWGQVVGTSAASPFVTAVLTRLGITTLAEVYADKADFNDVTTGSNDPSGTCGASNIDCNAGVGWDGPTGWGTPNAAALAGLDAGLGTSSGGASSGGASSGGTSSGGTSSGGTSSGSTGEDASASSSSGGTSSGGTSSGGVGTSSGSSFEDAGGSSGGADGGNFNSSGGNGSSGCAVGPAQGDSPFVPALSLLGLGAVIALRVRRRK
jgi:MYXO-CTERM domain-containing protein